MDRAHGQPGARDLAEPAPHGGRILRPPSSGLVRPRLTASLAHATLAGVFAPAGSGKSTLLAQVAATMAGPVAWLTVDDTDTDPEAFALSMAAATDGRLVYRRRGWLALDDAPLVVILDDVHRLAGTPAARRLAELVRSPPPEWRLMLAGRALDGLHLAPMVDPVPGDAATVLVQADDLRFRLWEIADLFAAHYDLRLSAAELPSLARNTGGWATALHLFGVAARRSPRRRDLLIDQIRAHSPLLRQYLTQQVLGGFDDRELRLAAQVAVFEQIRRPLAAELLGPAGAGVVDRLEQVGLLTPSVVPGELQLHALIRDHLLGEVSAWGGQAAVAVLHRRAAQVLEAHGLRAEAARAYLRSGTGDDVHRFHGPAMGDASSGDRYGSVAGDQWALWARGTTELRRGSLGRALRYLKWAQAQSSSPSAELQAAIAGLAAWLEPPAVPEPARPLGALRRWLAGDNTMVPVLHQDEGIAGTIHRLVAAGPAPSVPGPVGGPTGDRLAQALTTLVVAFLELLGPGTPRAERLREVELLLQTGVACPALERVYLALSAPLPTLDTGSGVLLSLTDQLLAAAEADGDELGSAVINLVVALRLGRSGVVDQLRAAGLARLVPLVGGGRARPEGDGSEPGSDQPFIKLIGPFRIGGLDEISPDPLLRPQHLAILQSLALHAAQWVSRDQLLTWFWPDADTDTGRGRLNTALTAIRRALEEREVEAVLRRHRDLYCLDPQGGRSDLAILVDSLRRVELLAPVDPAAGLDLLDRCLVLGEGRLLPAADAVWADEARWSLDEKWERSVQAVLVGVDADTTPRLVDLLPRVLAMGTRSDNLWRRSIELAERADAPLRAKQLRKRYERLLVE